MSDEFSFLWWNTSLHRTRKKNENAHTSRVKLVADVVRHLGATCSLLALAEVEENEFDVFQRTLAWDGMRWEYFAPRHICIGYQIANAEYPVRELRWSVAAHTRCYGGMLQLRLPSVREELLAYVMHWPSDMSGSAEELRYETASDLARKLTEREPAETVVPQHLLVLGDFNAEPFEAVMTTSLRATNDRYRVQQDKTATILYNPSWRFLCSRDRWPIDPQAKIPPQGTYYNTSMARSRWRVFDQVLVGKSLLGSVGWVFEERALKCKTHREIFNRVSGRMRRRFDHLPVVGKLRLLQEGVI